MRASEATGNLGQADRDIAEKTQAEPVWGTPAPAKQPWSRTHTLTAVGIAVVLAVGGGAVIYAATSGGRNEMEAGGPRMGPNGPSFGGSDMSTPVHGEFVVSDGAGGYRTEVVQQGTVTEVSDTSITARSDDGFTQTYIVNADTHTLSPDGLSVGDTAILRANADDGTFTATSLTEGRKR